MFINSDRMVDEDPEIFLTELETIVTRMNKCTIQGKSDRTDTDIILQVIEKLSKAYEIEVHQIKHDMAHNPGNVNIKVLRTKTGAMYARINELNNHSKKKDEHALKAIMKYNDAALGAFFVNSCLHLQNKYCNEDMMAVMRGIIGVREAQTMLLCLAAINLVLEMMNSCRQTCICI